MILSPFVCDERQEASPQRSRGELVKVKRLTMSLRRELRTSQGSILRISRSATGPEAPRLPQLAE